eukprot:1144584-Pelagomonas_calceolata.AAC.2
MQPGGTIRYGGAADGHLELECFAYYASHPSKDQAEYPNEWAAEPNPGSKSMLPGEHQPPERITGQAKRCTGATLVHRPYDPPTTKFRLREARQAGKEDRSSNERESRMIAERLEFQIFNSKQSQQKIEW